MGLKYSSGESTAVMRAMQHNLTITQTAIDGLQSGTRYLIDTVAFGDLKGAAYTAVRELFSGIIQPVEVKVAHTLADVNADLTAYRQADSLIARYGVLDEDAINAQIQEKRIQKAATETFLAEIGAAGQSIDMLADACSGGRYGLESFIHTTEQDIEKLKAKLEALHTFADSTSHLFKDSTHALELAMNGITGVNSLQLNADGTIASSGKGAVDFWLKTLEGIQLSSTLTGIPTQYRRQIEKIQNDTSLSAAQKADKIADVYEQYLYSLAPNAFNAYGKARSAIKAKYDAKYGSEENEYLSSPEFQAAEAALTKTLRGLPVNIKDVIRQMDDDDLAISQGSDLSQFMNMVNTGKPLDLKSRALTGSTSNYSIWSRGWNGNPLNGTNYPGQPSPDYTGNYSFGYYGQGDLAINGETLKMGAGLAQIWSDIQSNDSATQSKAQEELGAYAAAGIAGGGLTNPFSGLIAAGDAWAFDGYGDNPGDGSEIQDGITDYDKNH